MSPSGAPVATLSVLPKTLKAHPFRKSELLFALAGDDRLRESESQETLKFGRRGSGRRRGEDDAGDDDDGGAGESILILHVTFLKLHRSFSLPTRVTHVHLHARVPARRGIARLASRTNIRAHARRMCSRASLVRVRSQTRTLDASRSR